MINKLLGELHWKELRSRIDFFMTEERFSFFTVTYTVPHEDHKFMASCELLSSYINFKKYGRTDFWSRGVERHWTSGDIENKYEVNELIDELENNLLWVKNYLIERIIHQGCLRNIEGSKITLLPEASHAKKELFNSLLNQPNLEKIWLIFEAELICPIK